jgi:molybdenum cofactor biosynthesis enzyme MoaA
MDILKMIKELHYYWNINFNKLWKDLEIWIRIIKSCNEKCIFCSTDLDNKIIKYNDLLLIILFLIKSYWKKYNLSFSFTWWEPTIYTDLYKIISFVIEKWYDVKIETNAVNFSKEEYLKNFIWFKWKIRFFVSFHWHTESLYKTLTKSNFYSNSVLWIKNLCKIFWNKYIEINCVINNINFLYLNDYLKFVNNNFFYNWKIDLTLSTLLANKDNYDDLLVEYSQIINFMNGLEKLKINNICISKDAWWYCQLPFCIFSKLNFINKNDLLKYASANDDSVWNNVMYKWKECEKCNFFKKCLWISKKYYNKYW